MSCPTDIAGLVRARKTARDSSSMLGSWQFLQVASAAGEAKQNIEKARRLKPCFVVMGVAQN